MAQEATPLINAKFCVDEDGLIRMMWGCMIQGRLARQELTIRREDAKKFFSEMADKFYHKPLEKMPEDITTVDVRMTLMPNRELMFNGRSLGFIKDDDLKDVRRVIC